MFKKAFILVLSLGLLLTFNCCTCPKPELTSPMEDSLESFFSTEWMDSTHWPTVIYTPKPIPIDSTIKRINCREVPGEAVGEMKLEWWELTDYDAWGNIYVVEKAVPAECPEGTKPHYTNGPWINASNPPSRWYVCCKPEIKCDTIWEYIYDE